MVFLIFHLGWIANDNPKATNQRTHGCTLHQQREQNHSERHQTELVTVGKIRRQAENEGQGNRTAQSPPVHDMQPAFRYWIYKFIDDPSQTIDDQGACCQDSPDRPEYE